MWLSVFIRGIMIGLVASIPLGPIGVMCIQRTLSRNHRSGFVSGLGAATADMIFATIAFFFLSFILGFLRENMTVIKALGGLCVMAVGMKIFMSNPVVQIRRNRAGKSNLWQDYISMFFVTLANPAFILVFVALFAAFGLSNDQLGRVNGSMMVVGVFAGAASWWLGLTFLVNLFRRNFRPRHLLWINRIAGVLVIVLGFLACMSIFLNTPVDGMLQ